MRVARAAAFFLVLAAAGHDRVHAEPTAAPVRTEIDALLARLEASGCEFGRNGKWYAAAEARQHLLRKLEYAEGRGRVESAEMFIERIASGSSMSGDPYRVRCAGSAETSSAAWLTSELRKLRAPAGGGTRPK